MSSPMESYFRYATDSGLCLRSEGALSAHAGYFSFGSGVICYGRTATGPRQQRADQPLCDISRNETGAACLPFDPGEVVANLTYERYARANGSAYDAIKKWLARRSYYLVRPLLPLSLRSRVQKYYLNDWRRLPFPQWPVDTTVDRLMKRLLARAAKAAGTDVIPFIWFWPEGHSACSIMTHDVETEAGKRFCSRLMDINDEFEIPASFQVVPERRYTVPDSYLAEIKARGFEVNVQDLNHDGLLFSNYRTFEQRVKKINQWGRKFNAGGFRSAVLYRNQEWFHLLDFEYDMSVPNVAHLDPQRGGCCTVMPYYVGGMVELPVTTTQDHSLLHILNDYAIALWHRQMDLILQQNGLISFIVHPDYLLSARAQMAYRLLLVELARLRAERNVWIALPREVNRWWRQRSQMKLIVRRGQYVIEGEGSQRARVAFATVKGDEVVYSLPHRHAGDSERGDREEKKPYRSWPIPQRSTGTFGQAPGSGN